MQRYKLKAPSELCIYDNHTETLLFFDHLANAIFKRGLLIEVDLSEVTRMTAGAALLLFVESSRAHNCTDQPASNQTIQIIPPKQDDILRVFQSTKLAYACQHGSWRLDKLWGNGSNFITGNEPSKDIAKLRGWALKATGLPSLPANVNKAISEALLNVMHHAYQPENLHDFIRDRWWAYSHTKLIENQKYFVLAVIDIGIGIPTNVSPPNPSILGFLSRSTEDAKSIIKAFQKGYTSTNQPERGKGSADLISPVEEDNIPTSNTTPQGRLLVMSKKGVVSFERTGYKENVDKTYSLGGTYLEWRLPI